MKSRGWTAVLWGGLACRPPVLPPVPVQESVPVDLVPAGARADLLVAHRALAGGKPDVAAQHAGRATRLDPPAAAPWVVLAQARLALGDVEGAVTAADRAVELEPGAAVPRWMRATVEPRRAEAELDALVALGPASWGASLLPIAELALREQHEEALSMAVAASRSRAFEGGPTELQRWIPVWAAGDAGLAVVVAALRVRQAGAHGPQTAGWAQAGLRAAGPPDARWTPLPLEWRAPSTTDAFAPVVGYARGPDDDRGWHAARAGRHTHALELLTAAWRRSPGDPTLREQLWLVQQGGPR